MKPIIEIIRDPTIELKIPKFLPVVRNRKWQANRLQQLQALLKELNN
jgi:hypothetical protein